MAAKVERRRGGGRMTTPRTDETAANVNSSQRDARSGSLQRMVITPANRERIVSVSAMSVSA